VLVVERRQKAVSRREIFEQVSADVVVSGGALSQAIRTLRRTLGDESREPQFIRTVSRHGYSFVFTDVVEETADAMRLGELRGLDTRGSYAWRSV
jgi:DNA-binding winged helix-turn-helix (wHTH) protein